MPARRAVVISAGLIAAYAFIFYPRIRLIMSIGLLLERLVLSWPFILHGSNQWGSGDTSAL